MLKRVDTLYLLRADSINNEFSCLGNCLEGGAIGLPWMRFQRLSAR